MNQEPDVGDPTTVQTTDADRAFRDALPGWLRAQLHDTQRVTAAVTRAVGNGWTVEQLAATCTRDLAGYHNAGGLVTYRLLACSEGPPPPGAGGSAGPKRPFCGDCDHGLIYTEPDDPRLPVTATKCPCRSGS